MEHNYFMHNGSCYHQIWGTAMGTAASVGVANAHLGFVEQDLRNKTTLWPLRFYRLLDDGFLIWQHGMDALHMFLAMYNSSRPRIRITCNVAYDAIEYLDLVIRKDLTCMGETVPITFSTHQKPMNKYLYLPYTSHHPMHVYKGLVIGELIRYVVTNSYEWGYDLMKERFFIRLARRGYPAHFLHAMSAKVSYSKRAEYLHHAQRAPPAHRAQRFVTDYSAFDKHVNVRAVIQSVLDRHGHKAAVRAVFGATPAIDVVYRRGRCLGNHLVNARH
jgi:hypothetical protein